MVTAAGFNPNQMTAPKIDHGEFPISIEDQPKRRIVGENPTPHPISV